MLQTFLPLFIMTFGICLFIVLMQFLWRYIDDMVGKKGDFVVLNTDNYHFLPYYVGMNCVHATVKEGVLHPVL